MSGKGLNWKVASCIWGPVFYQSPPRLPYPKSIPAGLVFEFHNFIIFKQAMENDRPWINWMVPLSFYWAIWHRCNLEQFWILSHLNTMHEPFPSLNADKASTFLLQVLEMLIQGLLRLFLDFSAVCQSKDSCSWMLLITCLHKEASSFVKQQPHLARRPYLYVWAHPRLSLHPSMSKWLAHTSRDDYFTSSMCYPMKNSHRLSWEEIILSGIANRDM